MSPPCLALVRDVLNGPNSMTAEAAHRFDNLFACLCISTCAARRQFLRLGLRPQVLGDRIDFGGIPFVPLRTAVIAVPPELRHARFGFEVFRIHEPLPDPLLGEFSGNSRQIRPALADVFVARNLVATKAAVDTEQIATT